MHVGANSKVGSGAQVRDRIEEMTTIHGSFGASMGSVCWDHCDALCRFGDSHRILEKIAKGVERGV